MSDLLDQPPLSRDELESLERGVGRLLATDDDVIVVQAEAILTLEAVARSLGAPRAVAINVVTGPYGALFGDWMRAGGATVIDVVSDLRDVASASAVEAAFAAHPEAGILALVHAEAATGGTNPVAELAAVGRRHGALIVLDAVASIGAEPVDHTGWGVDVTVVGGQKSLAGPAGVSAAAVSARAWQLMESNPVAPRASFLSLLDLRDAWNRAGRVAVPGTPNTLESRGLLLALGRVEEEGLPAIASRHARASRAVLAGASALGYEPWQRTAVGRAPVVTTLVRPADFSEDAELTGIVSRGNGPLALELLRVNHTGRRATLQDARAAVTALGAGVAAPADVVAAAVAAAGAAWG